MSRDQLNWWDERVMALGIFAIVAHSCTVPAPLVARLPRLISPLRGPSTALARTVLLRWISLLQWEWQRMCNLSCGSNRWCLILVGHLSRQ